jgi:hypothetical protein
MNAQILTVTKKRESQEVTASRFMPVRHQGVPIDGCQELVHETQRATVKVTNAPNKIATRKHQSLDFVQSFTPVEKRDVPIYVLQEKIQNTARTTNAA